MEAVGFVRVEDLDSVNGTFINGTQIHRLTIVQPGDRLSFGSVMFVVEYDRTPKTQRRLEDGDANEIVDEALDLGDIRVRPGPRNPSRAHGRARETPWPAWAA
jgi:pSer/pThr/pTyr-binding forkhead associated (FHA) protein